MSRSNDAIANNFLNKLKKNIDVNDLPNDENFIHMLIIVDGMQ